MLRNVAVAAALAAIASSSFAADAPKFYAGVDSGRTQIQGMERGLSFGGFVGYQFHTNVAVEGGYRALNAFAALGPDIDQAAISVIGSVPLSSGFGVFARLGYNDVTVKNSCRTAESILCRNFESSNGVLAGVGATYALSSTMVARAEIQRPSDDLTSFSVGVSFGF